MATNDDRRLALEQLIELLQGSTLFRQEQLLQLTMQWPSLAAALGELLAAHECVVPAPLRRAAMLARDGRTQPNTLAVAGMGACAREGCGHVQHQHGNKWPGRCGLCNCPGWQVRFERPVI